MLRKKMTELSLDSFLHWPVQLQMLKGKLTKVNGLRIQEAYKYH